MDYKKLYFKIIENARSRPLTDDEYYEKHHILPRSLGGSNNKDNLIKLTSREHFICHLLLVRMYPEKTIEWYKMVKAFMMMKANPSSQKRYTSRMYEYYRTKFSEVQSVFQSGNNNSNFGTIWIFNDDLKKNKKIQNNDNIPEGWKQGRVLNWEKYFSQKERDEHKQLLIEKYGLEEYNRTKKEEQYNKIRGKNNSFYGKTHSNEIRQIMSEKRKMHPGPNKGKKLGPLSEETKLKISQKQSGSNNSQYGTIWITDGETNKKIKSNDIIPKNWFRGRTGRK